MAKKGTKPSKTRRFVKSVFNVREWSDWDRTKSGTNWLVETINKLFVPQQQTAEENFDEAMVRLKINEEDLENRKKSLLNVAILMAVFAFLIFLYAVYQLIYLNIAATILSFVVMGIALVLAFRYHFWYYQLKVRKLGCSIQEWFKNGLMGGSS